MPAHTPRRPRPRPHPRTRSRAVVATAVLAPLLALGGTGIALAADPGPVSGSAAVSGPAAGPVTGVAPAGPPGQGITGVPEGIARAAQGGDRAVAITIDDGPDPVWTPRVLDVLRRDHVHATFCMIGTNAAKYPDLVRAVVADGHRLCDHTVSHDETMDHKPVDYQRREILDGKAMIENAAPGAPVDYYRAPGGAFTPDSRRIAAAAGMRPLGWSVDPRDWSRPGTRSVLDTVEQLRAHPTVLFHDGGGDRSETVAALNEALPWFADHGYTFAFPDRLTP
ncbi:polysaccharide deacetylase family protein (plasmid) [Streptomyces sp. BI20]|uniref:polysaccharide deacetylase family protein n=1 Tax=Streptomyces sp. BI20 TaxID=3403460 RepID=UPI003C78B64D